MTELALKLGFWQEHSSPYYPQANGQVEVVNKPLKAILQRTIDKKLIQLAHHVVLGTLGIPNLETSSLEELLLHLEHLDEQRQDVAIINEAHKKRVKTQYDKVVHPQVFSEFDLVLVCDQDKDALGAGKFKSMWYGPFVVKRVLGKGAYELIDFEGNKLAEPRNGLYLKKFFA
eukprot:PITA_14973